MVGEAESDESSGLGLDGMVERLIADGASQAELVLALAGWLTSDRGEVRSRAVDALFAHQKGDCYAVRAALHQAIDGSDAEALWALHHLAQLGPVNGPAKQKLRQLVSSDDLQIAEPADRLLRPSFYSGRAVRTQLEWVRQMKTEVQDEVKSAASILADGPKLCAGARAKLVKLLGSRRPWRAWYAAWVLYRMGVRTTHVQQVYDRGLSESDYDPF